MPSSRRRRRALKAGQVIQREMTEDVKLRTPELGHAVSTVFLDRDGTINVKAPNGQYIVAPESLKLLPDAGRAIRRLNERDVRVVIVTNQRGIALGHLTETRLHEIHLRLAELLAQENAHFDAIYWCPHNAGECACRKPAAGMLRKAVLDHPQILFSESVVVGDSSTDMQAAKEVGALGIRILNQFRPPMGSTPPYLQVRNLNAAVDLILEVNRSAPFNHKNKQ